MKCSRKASAGIPSGLFRCKSGVIIVILILPYLEHLSYLHQFDARFTYLGQLVYLPISSSRAFIVNSLINSNLAIKFYRKLISIDHLGLVKKLNTYLPNFRCVSALSIFLKSQTFRWFNCEINWRKAYFKFKTTWGDNVSPNLVTLVNTISLSYTKIFYGTVTCAEASWLSWLWLNSESPMGDSTATSETANCAQTLKTIETYTFGTFLC